MMTYRSFIRCALLLAVLGGFSAPTFAATCFCKYLVNGTEVRTTTEGGYTQNFPGQMAKCEDRCRIELDAIKEEVARSLPNTCGKVVTVRVLSAIGTSRYRDVTSADVSLTCDTPPVPSAQTNQYAVKFVCGASNQTGPNSGITAPGRYFTAINIHNPTNAPLEFRKKFAIALPGAEGKITPWSNSRLGPDGALELDCPEILERIASPPTVLAKGFAVLEPFEPAHELDVVAVYTAGTERVETIDVERVSPRLVVPAPRCRGDLNLPIVTDVSRWTVTEVPAGLTNVPAIPYAPFPYSGTGPGGITAVNTAGASAIGGFYTYEFRFCLCQGFTAPALSLTVTSDNEAEIRINSNLVGTTPPNVSPVTVSTTAVQAGFFITGTNVLTIRVRNRGVGGNPNSPTATGVTANGSLSAKNALCP